MSAEDPLIPLRRAKGGHFDNDSTGFAARKLVWIPDIQEAQDGTKSNAGFVRASLKSQDGDKVVVVQEGNNRTHNLTDVSPVAALFTAMGLCGGRASTTPESARRSICGRGGSPARYCRITGVLKPYICRSIACSRPRASPPVPSSLAIGGTRLVHPPGGHREGEPTQVRPVRGHG